MANDLMVRPAKKAVGKKMVTASKATMNFARHKREFNPVKVALVCAVIILVAVLFTKFAILDPMQKKTDALSELSGRQDQMDILNARLAGWDDLQALYGRYSYGWMTDAEKSLVDRMDIIRLLETQIRPYATIQDFAIAGNVLTVNLEGLTLQQTSALVTLLEGDDLVRSATVYKASNNEDEVKFVNMVVILEKEAAENE